MVFENEAKVLCEGCGKLLGIRIVASPSEKRQIRIVFDLCEDCSRSSESAEREYGADDPEVYAKARILVECGVSESNILREFMELDDYIFKHMTEDHKTIYINELDEYDKKMLKSLKELRERAKEIAQYYAEVLEIYSSRVSKIKMNRWLIHKNVMKKLHDRKLAKLKRKWLKRKM